MQPRCRTRWFERSEAAREDLRAFGRRVRTDEAVGVVETKADNMQGTVKTFNSEKGFGFISSPGSQDVFVHHSNIVGEGYKSLTEGQSVQFEVGPGRKGEEARNVRVV